MDELYKQLKTFGKVKANEPMNKHTAFKIGGPARYFVEISDLESLKKAVDYLREEGVEYFILGGGSNLLVSDNGFDGVVLNVKANNIKIEDNLVFADAGCSTVEVEQKTMQAGLTGFEWGVGIPGTIGGAVRGNAGAMGGEMKDSVKEVEVYTDGEVNKLNNKECDFSYRTSKFKKTDEIILRVVLELKKGVDKNSMEKAMEYLKYRNKTQPQGYSSIGCIFKNHNIKNDEEKTRLAKLGAPDEFLEKGRVPVGWLVEQLGIKGEKIGNAQISEKHGNFIINLGGAMASDVLELIEIIKNKVYDKYGLELEEEIKILS